MRSSSRNRSRNLKVSSADLKSQAIITSDVYKRQVNDDSPVLVDRYIMGKELEVDAICDGKDVFIPGIMEMCIRDRSERGAYGRRPHAGNHFASMVETPKVISSSTSSSTCTVSSLSLIHI